jgi:hypothetical protein
MRRFKTIPVDKTTIIIDDAILGQVYEEVLKDYPPKVEVVDVDMEKKLKLIREQKPIRLNVVNDNSQQESKRFFEKIYIID